MKIKFSINYNTKWGENLYICGSLPILGENSIEKSFALNYVDNGVWEGEIVVDAYKYRAFNYRYFVKSLDSLHFEVGSGRNIRLNSNTQYLNIEDQWQGNSSIAPFLSSPFTDVYYAYSNLNTITHTYLKELIIRVTVPNVEKDAKLYLVGDCRALGSWDYQKGIEFTRMANSKWEIVLDCDSIDVDNFSNCNCKVVMVNSSGDVVWEEGENRVLQVSLLNKKHTTQIIEWSSASFNVAQPKFSGVAIPLFSLRGDEGWGIGDFSNLYKLIDWASKCNISIIQLLPINDTTSTFNWKDSYPYNCISAMALHPIYADLKAIGELKDSKRVAYYKKEAGRLNKLNEVDFTAVLELKLQYLREIYLQEAENTVAQPNYYSYIKSNKKWLYPYALFCTYRDRYKSANFNEWPEIDRVYKKESIKKLSKGDRENFNFYLFVQFHLHNQMRSIKEYASANRVALKGDIPIGVSPNSVEAWQFPNLFNFNQRAGAPPDDFSIDGQNWGFPTYNWAVMARDNYSWWRERLIHLSKYFHAYRIDHILGFFRIWEIPIEYKGGLMGHFSPSIPLSIAEIEGWGIKWNNCWDLFIADPYKERHYHPAIDMLNRDSFLLLSKEEQERLSSLYDYYFYCRHNNYWYKNAVKKLQQLIAATNMLACGEDLGMLNPSVEECMKNLKILSLELEIMPKQVGVKYADITKYPYLSVATTSTHDSKTLRMWLSCDNGVEDASEEECLAVLKRNLASNSMFVIFPMQDWLSIDESIRFSIPSAERINDPSNPNHYWRYRMHISIERLLKKALLNKKISALATR